MNSSNQAHPRASARRISYFGVMSNIECLPKECLAHVISFTTPVDACRSSAVSTAFQTAASSNTVWERFLPPDYYSILTRADNPVGNFLSKKELFLHLADEPILLDHGRMIFGVEKTSGAKCYMLSARSMSIAWVDTPLYWRWISLPESRFAEVAELIHVCWLDMSARINCRELSQNTTYTAYLVFNLSGWSCGLDCPTQVASITVGDQVSANHIVSLYQPRQAPQDEEEPGGGEEAAVRRHPSARDDGWTEVEMGEFRVGNGEEGEVVIRLAETTELYTKNGLIVEGVEIRPKKHGH